MEFKRVFFLVAFIVGCAAIPTPDQEDLSTYFEHVERSGRIVGGTQAAAGSHPHVAALSTGLLVRSLLCGASLIARRTVLTAAHCIDNVYSFGSLTNTLRVTVGTNRWNQGGQSYTVARNVTHANYVSRIIKNDIGVLITSDDIQTSSLVQNIPLFYGFVGAGVPARVAGWGRIRGGGAISANLLEIDVSTIDGEQCVRDVDQARIDLNRPDAPPVEPHIELCTFHSAGRGTCNGDSGSALVRTDSGQQVGVVSWGFPCALGAPDMFVRVSAYRDWIVQSTV